MKRLKRYCIWAVYNEYSRVFDEIALGLQSAFKQLGYRVPIVSRYEDINGCPIILNGHILPISKEQVPSEGIIYNLEYLESGSKCVTEEYLEICKRFEVWDFLKVNIESFKKLGIEAKYCPIGYADCLTIIPIEYPTIDVLFYGSINERRLKIINNLRSQGINVLTLFNVFGKERDRYIAKSKIILNIQYYDKGYEYFEAVRLSYLLSNQKFIISERTREVEEPYKKGIVFGSSDEIPELCKRYLNDDKGREKEAEDGFRHFSKFKQVDVLRELV